MEKGRGINEINLIILNFTISLTVTVVQWLNEKELNRSVTGSNPTLDIFYFHSKLFDTVMLLINKIVESLIECIHTYSSSDRKEFLFLHHPGFEPEHYPNNERMA